MLLGLTGGWLVTAAMAGPHPCADLPQVAEDPAPSADPWPADDVGQLEALALHGTKPKEAVAALTHLETEPARSALVRVACHAPRRYEALTALALDPRPDEWPLYAESLSRSPTIAAGLGSLGLPEGRRALLTPIAQGKPVSASVAHGLAADLSPEGVAAFQSLRDHPHGPAEMLRAVSPEHPAFDRLVAEAATSDDASVWGALLRQVERLPSDTARALVAEGLDHRQPEVRQVTARWLGRADDRFPRLHRQAASQRDPLRAVAYHRARAHAHPESLQALQRLRSDDRVRWEATGALLQQGNALSEDERNTLIGEVLGADDAPPMLRWMLRDALAEERRHHEATARASVMPEPQERTREEPAAGSPRPAPSLPVAAVAALDDRALVRATRHIGHRWLVLAALDTLPPERRTLALEGLMEAEWLSRPPQVVVDAAGTSTSEGAWSIRLQLGSAREVLEASEQPTAAGHRAMVACLRAAATHDPPTEVVERLRERLRSGGFPEAHLDRAVRVPALQAAAREGLPALLDDPCDGLAWVEPLDLDDDWVIEHLLTCRGPRPRLPRARLLDLQQLLLARQTTDAQLCTALSLDQSDAEVVRPYLDRDDRCVRQVVWGTLRRSPLTADLRAWVEQQALAGPERRRALEVLTHHDAAATVDLLAQRVADGDDAEAARALHRIGTTAAIEALVPLMQRGTYPRLVEVAHWVRAHGGPVYEAHRAQVDAVLTPTWTTTP